MPVPSRLPSPLDPRQARRDAGLLRLSAFLPRAGAAYRRDRNRDEGPGERQSVSMLSPWLRHRLLTEQEVVAAALAAHGPAGAEMFVQEVCWRSYWKGWLQQRPAIWQDYLRQRDRDAEQLSAAQRHRLGAAEAGASGIAAIDAWTRELCDSGYLHNHARMWFASIWIFTLRLPWTLGADFFHRHLLDGDAASNTLSWRWVAGLQTPGKHYLARADNIARYTGGRFRLHGQLDEDAAPLAGKPHPPVRPLADLPAVRPGLRSCLLLTDEDLHPESWPLPQQLPVQCILLIDGSALRSPRVVSGPVRAWTAAALRDGAERAGRHFDAPARQVAVEALAEAVVDSGSEQLLLAEPTVGPLADALAAPLSRLTAAALPVVPLRRPWDAAFWPHARRGFFALKRQIPAVLPGLLT